MRIWISPADFYHNKSLPKPNQSHFLRGFDVLILSCRIASSMHETNENRAKTFGEGLVMHQGIVSKISNNTITVSLNGNLHCEACNARSACGVSDTGSKEIEINDPGQSMKLNENVEVFLKKDLGLKAVFWAYVFPFLLLLVVLLLASEAYEEWVAGLLAIGVLIPYYLTLYALRKSIGNRFKVSVSKIS